MDTELKLSLNIKFMSPYAEMTQNSVVFEVPLSWTPVGRKQEAPWAQNEGNACLVHEESRSLLRENKNCPTIVQPQEKWTLLPIQSRDTRSANGFRGYTHSMKPEHTMLYCRLSMTSRHKTMVPMSHGSPQTGKKAITS